MKRIFTTFAFLLAGIAFAQQGFEEQIKELKEKSDKFNVFLNFQSSFDAVTEKRQDTQLGFKARQLRLEFRGDINERIFYRLRHRLNKNNAAGNLDNLSRATDLMYAGFRLNEKWTLTAGKMCQTWGGMEFDLNPMNIYEYSDFVNSMDNFMVGGMLTYVPNKNNEFNFQITNSRNNFLQEVYGTNLPSGIEKSGSPLTYIANWNANLFDGVFQMRWAMGLETEAKSNYSKMVTLGNKLNLDRFQIFLDYMYANQDLDRLYLSTGMALKDVSYNTFILKAEYQPTEKWNIFAKGMYETGNLDGNNVRKSYGYFCGIEYLPFKDQDLRFFLAYIGRKYSYKMTSFNSHSNRLSIGMMYRIKAF